MSEQSTAQIIAEGMPALLRGLEQARRDNGDLTALTAHILVLDGEVLVTVRSDGRAYAEFDDKRIDISAGLAEALGRT